MFNPCFCISLQKGVAIIAVLSLIFSILLVGEEITLVALNGCKGINEIQDQNPEFGGVEGLHYEEPSLYNTTAESPSINSNPVKINITTRKPIIINNDKPRINTTLNFNEKTSICSLPLSDVIVSVLWIMTWFIDIGVAILLIYGVKVKSIKLCKIWFYIRCASVIFKIIFLIIYLISGLSLLPKIPVILLCLFRIYSLIVVNYYINELSVEKEAREKPRASVASSMQDLQKFGSEQNVVGTPLW